MVIVMAKLRVILAQINLLVGDIEGNTVGGEGLQGGNALPRRRHLDHDVAAIDPCQQAARGGHGANLLPGQRGIQLNAGKAIQTILMSVDPPLVIIGGSVAKARDLFQESMWESIRQIPFPSVLENFRVEFSETEHIAIKGAAALCPVNET